MSINDFIILEDNTESERYKQFLKDKERYKELMLPFLESNKLNNPFTRLTAEELTTVTTSYYSQLEEADKLIFSAYYDNFLMQYIAKFTAPIEKGYEAFKTMLQSVRDKSLWNVDKVHPLFGFESNMSFHRYVMEHFKQHNSLYTQFLLSYVFWTMESVLYSKGTLYLKYCFDNYPELKLPAQVKAKKEIQKPYKLEQYNSEFEKALETWNSKNPLLKKTFKPLDALR